MYCIRWGSAVFFGQEKTGEWHFAESSKPRAYTVESFQLGCVHSSGHLTGSIQKRDILRLTVLCECIRAHVSVHSRLAFNIGCLPWLLSALFPLRQDLLLSLELADSARLTAPSQHWNHRPALLYQLVHGEWESELRFLCLYGQWSHFLNPKADS